MASKSKKVAPAKKAAGGTAQNDDRYRTQAAIANEFGVNQRTVARWVTVPGFPKKSKDGWGKSAVDQFVAKNTLGKGPTEHKVKGVTLTEANILKTLEDIENARIKKETSLAEQARQLGELVQVDDVRRLYLQTVATVTAVHDSLIDAVDRAMPEASPSKAAYAEVRTRVMGICKKLAADVAAAMKEMG